MTTSVENYHVIKDMIIKILFDDNSIRNEYYSKNLEDALIYELEQKKYRLVENFKSYSRERMALLIMARLTYVATLILYILDMFSTYKNIASLKSLVYCFATSSYINFLFDRYDKKYQNALRYNLYFNNKQGVKDVYQGNKELQKEFPSVADICNILDLKINKVIDGMPLDTLRKMKKVISSWKEQLENNNVSFVKESLRSFREEIDNKPIERKKTREGKKPAGFY